VIRGTLMAVASLALAACVHRVEPTRPEGSASTPSMTVKPVAPKPVPECRAVKLPARPVEPAVDWHAKSNDCSTKFLGCLSGADFEAMQLYLQSIRQWAQDAERRCHGR
jgi:hypothetical protein